MSYTVIDDFIVPESQPVGSAITARLLLRNAGALGRLDYYIDGNPLNPSDYMFIGGGGAPNVPPEGSVWVNFTSPFSMPAWDYTLIASNEDNTSIITRTINSAIETTITLEVQPMVSPGVIFSVSGYLTETISGLPISGKTITILLDGLYWFYRTTDVNGLYGASKWIDVPRTYTIEAIFAG